VYHAVKDHIKDKVDVQYARRKSLFVQEQDLKEKEKNAQTVELIDKKHMGGHD